MVGPSPGYLTLQGIVILHAENLSSAEMAAAISPWETGWPRDVALETLA